MKTTTLEYRELFDKIFTNCTSNEGNAQSITSRNCTLEQASNIDLQLNTPLTFDQYGISNMSDESNNPERENRAKKICVETLSVLDPPENSIHKNRATTIPKFRAPFTKEMKKSMRSEFLISTSTRTT